MSLTAAIIPAAPLVLPAASPDQPAPCRDAVTRLRRETRAVITTLSGARRLVVAGPGPRGIHDHAATDLRALGVEAPPIEVSAPPDLRDTVSHATGYPVLQGEPLSVELTVLTRLIAELAPGTGVAPLSVPCDDGAATLDETGRRLGGALTGEPATGLVVAGDLSAGLDEASPAYAIAGAPAYDQAVMAAFERGDLGAIRGYGPDEARRVRARGWACLLFVAGCAWAANLSVSSVSYHAPRGVGGLVASLVDGRGKPGP